MAYYKEYFMVNKSNNKEIWNGIRQIISLKTKHSFSTRKLIKENDEINNIYEITNEFNNFFSNIGKILSTAIPPVNVAFQHYLDTPQDSTFFLFPTTAMEIENINSTFSSSKASGLFSIPTSLLKILKVVVSYPLEIRFNYFFYGYRS